MRTEETRLVLDTNTLISRMLVPQGTAGRAVDKALAQGVLLASEETLTELANVLSRPKFDRYVSLEARQQFLKLLGGVVRVVPIQHRIQACRDPKDDMLLHVALNGEAQCLVTGDQDLLILGNDFWQSHGLRILSPADYLALI
ncbi:MULTISPECIES: putative toxin-antitoxin system toxin component, PIN family [unclassified Ectothiorhodospira]|uniref:putative toxin-antitoxin system toxin component, PIN family n=1 Tax=unclassified Ectothiorhodospira TaxID=2684909 RepID=UPI0007B42B4F|nr:MULTISPECIES: putative toxin-antitoxin system toxin component, PIN family [unclassified Ectothiorhodospira]ANB02058.1 DNA-binding protein [Ectothiorhodospira sp. BSL-9]MCG5517075.1 putative toxin-antitoxin system toxin component, PIN family [Ectothiorhodospira sp. 9100]MCG5520063.1 putative toxin-antitoxin system toxin component, PIN family [Ectothiorhodospira sp. 9905]